ncbi:MAG TPA: alginate lyase family protein [Solirubrobacteraceae bacterium]
MSAPAAVAPLLCPIEHLHRDLALAEAVTRGVFTCAGTKVELGIEPDWLGAELPADEEWRIEWVKFYYGLDLAWAYRTTGEARFRSAWERLVGSFVAQVPPDADPSEVTARRITNWLYAWPAFPETPLAESIGAQALHVRANLTPERNHRTLELYALLLVALALPGLDEGLCSFAVEALHRNLLADFRGDGVHREASTHYHMIALRSFVAARENGRLYGVEFPVGYDERLAAACEFAVHCRRPDGTIPALSDADTGDYSELLRLAGAPAPERTHASFPDAGYFVQRSRWDRDARFAIFDCGPLGDGGHGHYDLLSLEAWAGGHALVLDPGRFTYAEGAPNWRRWFRGTAAHNTVTVDGCDQTPYRRGRSDARPATGRLLYRAGAPGLDVIAGEARSPLYDAVHRRRLAFVAGAYWIVEDRLTAPSPHRYDVRWHLAPDAQGLTRVLEGGVVLAPGVAIAIAGAEEIVLEDGWVSPRYGVKVPAPVVSASLGGVRDAVLVTLLAPCPGGAPPALTCVECTPWATVVRVGGVAPDGARDTLSLTDAGAVWERATPAGERVDGAAVRA